MNELLAHIESIDFSVMLNVASGFNTVLGILKTHDTVLKLIGMMHDWHNQLEIANRITELSDHIHPCDEENPYDAAIAAYLYILATHNMALTYKCCVRGNGYWSGKMIDYIKGKK